MAQLPVSSSTRGKHVYKPFATGFACDEITLAWGSENKLEEGYSYEIFYKEQSKGKFIAYKSEESCYLTKILVQNLKPDTAYVFKVRIVNEDTGEEGPYSQLSDGLRTSTSSIAELMNQPYMIKDKPILLYRLPIEETKFARNDRWHTRKFTYGHQIRIRERCIMMVGATGSGKSTLVNALANYVIGVRLEDSCRFEMVQLEENEIGRSEAQSQTQWATCYTIYTDETSRLPYNITIIDTPGFGHTEGLQSDAAIVDQIRELFLAGDGKGVYCIDAICFVVKSPDARLTFTQQYIFRSILALFGKDIKGNICTIVTFSDGQEPPVIQALSQLDEEPIPYKIYFPVNSSAIFSSNSDQNPTSTSVKFFWSLAMKSFDNFFKHVELLQAKSLSLTTEVMCLRQAKENTIFNLQLELDSGFIMLNSIQEEMQIFEQHTREINDNKDFTYQVEECKLQKIDITGQGIYTTNCLICSYTCHANCAFSNDDDKAKCIAMDADGKCTECPNKCFWKIHHNVPCIFKVVKTKVTKTYHGKKAAYEEAKQKKLSQEEMVAILHSEMEEKQKTIFSYLEMITQHTNLLKEKALLPNTLSTVQYIELLIDTEKRIKREGFQSRIKELERCKERATINTTVKRFESQLQITTKSIPDGKTS